MQNLRAQQDSVHLAPLPLLQKGDTLNKMELSDQETKELQLAISNPIWFLLTKIAPIVNIGAYYSYLTPLGTFKTQVSSASSFSADVGLNLTRIFGHEDDNIHWFIGMNADFTNFGKATDNHSQTLGDTSYKMVLKNSLEVYSYYVEAEYRKTFLCPFASVAYSSIYLNPYKEVETTIRNATTNTSETAGDYAGNNLAHGINLALGLKCKYRFNEHKELMLLTKVSYLTGSATDMIDLSTASFTSTGQPNYQTIRVYPTWLLYSIGIKYNF